MSNYSYGLEIEAVDFSRLEVELPKGCEWAKKEVTLVNSNGLACDSTKKSKNYLGGEINTPATQTIKEQIKIAKKCFKRLKKAGANINYRCNLQSHVGNWFSKEDEKETLKRLKAIQSYAFENYDKLLMMTMGEGQYNKKPEYPVGFWAHYKERMLPEWKHNFMMEAKTLDGFRKAMFFSKAGTHAPMTFARQGINTHSFFKTGTIEFRFFWASLDLEETEAILNFSKDFMDDALGSQSKVKKIIKRYEGSFPKELPFNLELEKGFQATKVKKP